MKKLIGVAVVAILAGAAGGWALRRPTDPDPRPAIPAQRAKADPSPDESVAGTVTLGSGAAKRMGLAVTVLKTVWHAPQWRTSAVVLSPRGLATLSVTYVTDEKDLAMAKANLAVVRNEYRRQNVLYRQDQNTSLKALQAARGALEAGQAQTRAARLQLHLDTMAARQQWGPVIGKWFVKRSPALEKILAQKQWLVEVTFGPKAPSPAPQSARLLAPSGVVVPASLLSSFPETNPVIQGLNFLYVIPARPGFAPGMNLVAETRAGAVRSGVVIPAAAVVWSLGEAWAYKEISPGRFERLPVSTREPVEGGWFVRNRFAPGDRVVTGAAEELFSAEAQAAGSHAGAQGDDD